ncbi:MAG: sucrose synthase [Bacteroidetes bacterium]|nr:sucrose synthase [Bacteroidota bacterium]MBU2585292.1 sucrose synthase [Bacteroidota bacterium]
MTEKFLRAIANVKEDFFNYLHIMYKNEKNLYVRGDLLDLFRKNKSNFKSENVEVLQNCIETIQESFCMNNSIYLDVREEIAASDLYYFNLEEVFYEKISVIDYLKAKEKFVEPFDSNDILTLNFESFYRKFPSVRDSKNIGAGVEYLNRYLSSQMFNEVDKWRKLLLKFIKLHKHNSEQLVINDRIKNVDQLSDNIDKTIDWLMKIDEKEPYENLRFKLQELGFEAGLGLNAREIIKSLKLLDGLLQSPDYITLKEFISRIPMIFNIAVISPHGYFAQENVLGLPDTGGQVVYILDQVKALEKSLIDSLQKAGLKTTPKIIILTRLIPNANSTTCNKRLEKVYNTKNTWILRTPFRTKNPKVTDNWISRFEIWPYLEEFAEDSYRELIAEFGTRPDLVIGNYSDGNIVAYNLAKRFGVTQCCIAHALEKSKYLYSALYWKDLEQYYNFSIQFTADIIAMNSADFLITSTYQEIAGTGSTIGQYESFKHFTMPSLYRVESGINLYHPKFNIVSPGVNENIYYSYTRKEKRIEKIKESLAELLFGNIDDEDVLGKLDNPNATPIFTMARLDKIKNVTALVRWYGKSEEMQSLSNLIIVAGKVDPSRSSDIEEIEQIQYMHNLINSYNLHNKIRWIGKIFRKNESGEVYRLIADYRGIFVQSGLFEGFGLTVLEAMISGLPVFATQYGGPLEIIQDSINGFHIDPINDEESTEKILGFLKKIKEEPEYWLKISRRAIQRVNESYSWKLYADKLLSLAKIYGFWKYVKDIEMTEMNSYLEALYYLLYKPHAQKILEKHSMT